MSARSAGLQHFLAHLITHFFRTCENFRVRSLNIRSPGHVKWPHLRKSWNARHSYTEWLITLKLSANDILTGSIKCVSRNLNIGDPKSVQLCDLFIAWVNGRKLKRACFGRKPFETLSNIGLQLELHPESEYCDQLPILMSPMSFQVMKGHQQFFANNFW